MIEKYLAGFKAELTRPSIVTSIEIIDEFVTEVSGFIDCKATLIDGSVMFLTEFVKIESSTFVRDKYSYHMQNEGQMVFRYDNAPHHREISTFPHHKHVGGNREEHVVPSMEMTLIGLLREIGELLDAD